MITYSVEIKNLKELQERFKQAPDITATRVIEAGNKSLIALQGTAKQLAPIDTGRLRSSMLVSPMKREGNTFSGSMGTNVQYACIFDAHTRIITKDGYKIVGRIEVGDLVLTQAGDYQPVIAKTAFKALEKPELVDIEVEWRKGSTHKITVTKDHKILAFRDGRNKWIEAGELQVTDLLYIPIKKSHNKGIGQKKPCLNCGAPVKDLPSMPKRKYCNWECKMDHWNAGANPHIGMKRSDQARKNMSEAIKKRDEQFPELQINRILGKKGRKTSCEQAVEEWLQSRSIEYEPQRRFGKHYADFYLPESHTIIEADGSYWHQDQENDIERDEEILEVDDSLTIIHLHFYEKRFSPDLIEQPIPDVHYVSCNPGPASFSDPETFRKSKIRSLHQWTYGTGARNPHASFRANLYDLTIANVHSFVANGIIVSNSWMEQGTGIYGPYKTPIVPKEAKALYFEDNEGTLIVRRQVKGVKGKFYMKGAVEKNQRKIDGYFEQAAANIAKDLAAQT